MDSPLRLLDKIMNGLGAELKPLLLNGCGGITVEILLTCTHNIRRPIGHLASDILFELFL